jgi:hypothetical protein
MPTLLDRQRERAALDGLLGDLRSGHGRALVVRGEAGVGKSALLEYVTGAAVDMRLVRAVGVSICCWRGQVLSLPYASQPGSGQRMGGGLPASIRRSRLSP